MLSDCTRYIKPPANLVGLCPVPAVPNLAGIHQAGGNDYYSASAAMPTHPSPTAPTATTTTITTTAITTTTTTTTTSY